MNAHVRTPSLPSGWRGALDGASPLRRTAAAVAALLAGLALVHALAWPPLARDIERTRESLARDRATLASLERDAVAAPAAPVATFPPLADARVAVARVLDARGLRTPGTQVEAREARVLAVLDAARFDALVAAVDDLARVERLRLVEARMIARIEPGTVRAELTFSR